MKKLLSLSIAAALIASVCCVPSVMAEEDSSIIVYDTFNNTISASTAPDFSNCTLGTGVESYQYSLTGDGSIAMTPGAVTIKADTGSGWGGALSNFIVNFTDDATRQIQESEGVEVIARVAVNYGYTGELDIFDGDSDSDDLNCYLYGSKLMMYNSEDPKANSDGNIYCDSTTFSLNSYFYIKAELNFQTKQYIMSISTDGETYSVRYTHPMYSGFTSDLRRFTFGTWSYSSNLYAYIASLEVRKSDLSAGLSSLSIPETASTSVTMDATTANDLAVEWTSSDESVIDLIGNIYPNDENTYVTLTAAVNDAKWALSKDFTVFVQGTNPTLVTDPAATVTSFAYDSEAGAFVADIAVDSLSDADVPVTMLVAQYDTDGSLMSVSAKTETVLKGLLGKGVTYTKTADALTSGQSAKLMVLTLDQIDPLCASALITAE